MRKIPFLLTSLFLAAGASAQGHLYVHPTGNDVPGNGTLAQPFRTINYANSVALNGAVIHLFAATYGDEQGNVLLGTKTVTLVGAGQGVTRIKAHSTTNIVLNSGPLPGTAEAHRPAVTVNGTSRVDMRDLTLDQGFSVPSTGRAYCLWIGGGADSVIDNVEFTNARNNPIDLAQEPCGVNIRGDNAGDTTRVELHNCLVHEYGKGGVVVNFNAHMVMDDCRVRGFDHAPLGLPAQNGIQVSGGANCEIRRTTVTNNWYDGPIYAACGILFYGMGTSVVVEDCSLGNCQAAIYFIDDTASVISGTIRRNRVHTSEYAWFTWNVGGLTVTDNSFSVSQSGDNNDAQDEAGGNTYSGNNYSSVSTAGPHLLPGAGAELDPTGKPTVRGLGASVVTPLPAGHSPQDMVVTGLDANGSPDFATVSTTVGTPALTIGLNTGTGAFTVTTLSFGAASGKPVAIVAGEFNGNTNGRDLAVLTVNETPALTENKVYVFANNGSGGFSLLYTHPLLAAIAPNDLAAGRLDADGVDDLAVADLGSISPAGNVTALLNNGTGTLFTSVPLVAVFAAACRGVTIADLDGDGNNDVAATDGSASIGRLHLWRGTGAGVFTPFASSPITTSLNANQVLATDLEGDLDQDLLVSATRDAFAAVAGAVDVLENRGLAGWIRSEWRCDQGPAGLAAGDFDADADPDSWRRDAAVVNMAGGSVSVLSTWTSGCGYGSGGIAALTMSPTAVAIADINGDGYADLAYCSAPGSVTVVSGVTQARADSYGQGSTGTSGRVPYLQPLGNPALPIQPNASFGLGLSNALPFSVAAFAAGLAPAPILPNNILISSIGATWVVTVNSFGKATVTLPIPPGPPLIGLPLYCQAGVFDANATESFLVGIALTKGLKLRVGN